MSEEQLNKEIYYDYKKNMERGLELMELFKTTFRNLKKVKN